VAALGAGLLCGAILSEAGQNSPSAARKPQPPGSLRLYVFDCGTLHVADPARFRLKKEDVAATDLSVASFLVAHPKGTLMWDAGAVPDADWRPTGAPVRHHINLPDSQTRDVTIVKALSPQLAAVGYAPSDITFFALSHYHYDHTANANDFASATWIVRQAERDAMFTVPAPGTTLPSSYAALRKSKTLLVKNDEQDVFGDGTVVIKSAPGHTPGHQVLCLRLARTGSIVLSGDLYHYPAMRALDRVATFEFDQSQSRSSRAVIEAFLKQTGAMLWIQHDLIANKKLKKAPDYYE
jgi:glyoxylase-like metal-dependent hydrolase (beta-lactamase superfamily II)